MPARKRKRSGRAAKRRHTRALTDARPSRTEVGWEDTQMPDQLSEHANSQRYEYEEENDGEGKDEEVEGAGVDDGNYDCDATVLDEDCTLTRTQRIGRKFQASQIPQIPRAGDLMEHKLRDDERKAEVQAMVTAARGASSAQMSELQAQLAELKGAVTSTASVVAASFETSVPTLAAAVASIAAKEVLESIRKEWKSGQESLEATLAKIEENQSTSAGKRASVETTLHDVRTSMHALRDDLADQRRALTANEESQRDKEMVAVRALLAEAREANKKSQEALAQSRADSADLRQEASAALRAATREKGVAATCQLELKEAKRSIALLEQEIRLLKKSIITTEQQLQDQAMLAATHREKSAQAMKALAELKKGMTQALADS